MPPPNESTSLVPVARQLNWRQKCYKFFHWSFYFFYFLLLLGDMVYQLCAASRIIFALFYIHVIVSIPLFFVIYIVFTFIDTLICWFFVGFVARSPRFVCCVTVIKNLIRLPQFWTLVSLFVLYILGASLVLWQFFSSASQNQDATMKAVFVLMNVMDVLNVFTKFALVVVLNFVQVRNVARSRFNYTLLKGTLVVIWNSQMFRLIFGIGLVYLSVLQQVDPFGEKVITVFQLPFFSKTTELIWIKLFQDNKCIIGKYEGSSFTRQNPRVSNTIETII